MSAVPHQRAGVALGSNLGDRESTLATARDRLRGLSGDKGFLQASLYRSEPVDCPDDSPEFLNTVVEFPWDGGAYELLHAARAIESDLGRVRDGTANAPRAIDLDLLYYGDLLLDDPELTLPHPRLTERPFVLAPLAEIRPDLRLPGEDRTLTELLQQFPRAPLEVARRDW